MLFNSFEFLLFYVVVVAVYFCTPFNSRWMLLLTASYYFYMSWKPEYVVLIMAATLINYGAALGMEKARSEAVRRSLLGLAVASSLSILFVFKYLDFFSQTVQDVLAAVSISQVMPVYALILPLGISFYTFQSIGYAIDVYRGDTRAERHVGIFALYVSFFPQLIAGPIERSYQLLPQFREKKVFEVGRTVDGLRLVLWGLVKKLLVADSVAVVVDTVYATPSAYTGPYLVLATFFFAVQIYCDFSGYSDMAVGTAKILGYDLMLNFRRPYFATSVADFWRRWHISLSTWFRDYVYRPLGGNRVSERRWVANIMMVFLLSGVWHGANWTFVVWGAIHGVTMVLGRVTAVWRARVAAIGVERLPGPHRAVQSLVVCTVAVTAWVFFRAQSVEEAFLVLAGFGEISGGELDTLWSLGLSRFQLATTCAAIVVLFTVEWVQEFSPAWARAAWSWRAFRWAIYATAFYSLIAFGVFGHVEFIYFQF